jgi:chemotaxis protein MotA
MKGISPLLACEMGRRAVPSHLRPSFNDFEKHCKKSAVMAAPSEGAAAAAPEAAAASS